MLIAEASGSVGLLEGIATTRAIRRYRPDPIPEADLAKVLFAATRAPSGTNRQPTRFLVLRREGTAGEARTVLGDAYRSTWAELTARDERYGARPGASERREREARVMQHFVDNFEDSPVIVLVCVVRDGPPIATEAASVYPACQNLLLAARALGYGGVITVWHRRVADEIHALLDIPDHAEIMATIPLGVPVGRHGPVRRRPLRDVVFEDRWGASAEWAVEPQPPVS